MDRDPADRLTVDEAYVTWPRLLLLLTALVAPLASTSGYALIVAFDAKEKAIGARPDPFTGTEARHMESKLIGRDQAILDTVRREMTAQVGRIEYAVNELRDAIREMHAHESLGHKTKTK